LNSTIEIRRHVKNPSVGGEMDHGTGDPKSKRDISNNISSSTVGKSLSYPKSALLVRVGSSQTDPTATIFFDDSKERYEENEDGLGHGIKGNGAVKRMGIEDFEIQHRLESRFFVHLQIERERRDADLARQGNRDSRMGRERDSVKTDAKSNLVAE
jgi:hypothetical protein